MIKGIRCHSRSKRTLPRHHLIVMRGRWKNLTLSKWHADRLFEMKRVAISIHFSASTQKVSSRLNCRKRLFVNHFSRFQFRVPPSPPSIHQPSAHHHHDGRAGGALFVTFKMLFLHWTKVPMNNSRLPFSSWPMPSTLDTAWMPRKNAKEQKQETRRDCSQAKCRCLWATHGRNRLGNVLPLDELLDFSTRNAWNRLGSGGRMRRAWPGAASQWLCQEESS